MDKGKLSFYVINYMNECSTAGLLIADRDRSENNILIETYSFLSLESHEDIVLKALSQPLGYTHAV